MADYYVAKNGNDSTGVGSEGNPWLTIQKGVTEAFAGDTVYVKVGTYNEYIVFPRSGTLGNPITITNYSTDTVIVDANGISIPSGLAIFFSSANSYLTIDGFEITDSNRYLVRIKGVNVSSPITNIIIQNCEIHANTSSSNDGILCQFLNGGLIYNNNCYAAGWNCINVTSSNDVIISSNYVHDNSAHAAINVFPQTIESPQGNYYRNHILFNKVIGISNPGAAIFLRKQIDNIIAGNLIAECSSGLQFDNYNSPEFEAHTQVLNNTFVDLSNDGFQNENATHVTVKNNIFAYNTDFDMYWFGTTHSGSVCNNNLFYNTLKIGWNGSTYTSIASWKSGSGQGENSIDGDPDFTDRPGDDYSIAIDSAAINIGADVSAYGINIDIDDEIRPQGSYDLGAYEYPEGGGTYIPYGIYWFEAEIMTFGSPMVKTYDANASGNYYVSSPTENSGTASIDFSIENPAVYKIEATVYNLDASSDSFFVTIDAEDEILWDTNPEGNPAHYNNYIEDDVTSRGSGDFDNPEFDPYTIYLDAGDHTISIRCRDSNTRIDRLRFIAQVTNTDSGTGRGILNGVLNGV